MFQCLNISLSVFRFSALYSAAASCTTSLSIIHIRARLVVSLSLIGSSPGSYVLKSSSDLQHSLPNPIVRHNSCERLISLLSFSASHMIRIRDTCRVRIRRYTKTLSLPGSPQQWKKKEKKKGGRKKNKPTAKCLCSASRKWSRPSNEDKVQESQNEPH